MGRPDSDVEPIQTVFLSEGARVPVLLWKKAAFGTHPVELLRPAENWSREYHRRISWLQRVGAEYFLCCIFFLLLIP